MLDVRVRRSVPAHAQSQLLARVARASRVLADGPVKSTFDFMKRTSVSAALVAPSGGSAASR